MRKMILLSTTTTNFLVICCFWLAGSILQPWVGGGAEAATTTKSEQVRFGTIEMQMRSRSTSTRNDFLFQVLSQTGQFLDEILTEEYAGTKYDFSHVTLSVDDVGVEESSDNKATDAYVTLQGTAIFAEGKAPPNDSIVHEVVNRAFQEENTLFLELLTNSKNPLLRDMTFAIVTVNEHVVVEEGNYINNATANINNGNDDNNDGNNDEEEGGNQKLELWMIIVIAISGTCLVIVFLVIACCTCRIIREGNINNNNNRNIHQGGKPPSRMVQASRTEDTPDIENSVVVVTRSTSEDGLSSSKSSRSGLPHSPSPLHSMTSQDSSTFTYNPPTSRGSNGSGGGGCNGGGLLQQDQQTATTGGGEVSAKSFFTNNSKVEMDVEAWQRGSTVAVNSSGVFGHDVSAIEKRDLSLIEEGDNESTATPQSSSMLNDGNSRASLDNSTSLLQPRRLTQRAVADMEERRNNNERRTRTRATSTSSSGSRRHTTNAINLSGPAAHVIDELNDLSAQIDDYRRR